jgi:hypothetical protein
VIDSSKLDVSQTLELILKKLKDGRYINQPNVALDRLGMDEQFLNQNLETAWTRWKCLVCGYVYEGSEPLSNVHAVEIQILINLQMLINV